MLNEFEEIRNYILIHYYDLDNNEVGQTIRYISLIRRNSLFFRCHSTVKRLALIYSIACFCKLNNINTFKYFTDILNRLAYIKPDASDEIFFDMLPNLWNKLE